MSFRIVISNFCSGPCTDNKADNLFPFIGPPEIPLVVIFQTLSSLKAMGNQLQSLTYSAVMLLSPVLSSVLNQALSSARGKLKLCERQFETVATPYPDKFI
jgi:hypothetical protein